MCVKNRKLVVNNPLKTLFFLVVWYLDPRCINQLKRSIYFCIVPQLVSRQYLNHANSRSYSNNANIGESGSQIEVRRRGEYQSFAAST